MSKINQQEADLEATISEYPYIDLLKKQIKPYYELWELVRDWNKCQSEWLNNAIKQLVPDDVEKEHKRMQSAVIKLVSIFEAAKLTKPCSVA